MWPYPRVLAHRGGGTLAPENTIAALRCGKAYGFSGVEFDVMLAADGTPVLMHDSCFGRTIAGSGRVADASAGQLAAMDAGGWFSAAYRGEGVPTLQQALEFCVAQRIWPNIEMKEGSGCARQTGQAVARLVRSFYASVAPRPASGDTAPMLPLLSSFSLDAVVEARQAAPEIPRAFLVKRVPADWQNKLAQCGGMALHVSHRGLTKNDVIAIRDAGYAVFCYTVNDLHRAAELFSWGIDAFCTDKIDVIGPNFAAVSPPLRVLVDSTVLDRFASFAGVGLDGF